jgi:plasmid stabilization system protein ParE
MQAIIELLLVYPNIGVRRDDPVIRHLTRAPYPYLVFYEVTDREIIIHAVRHAARNPSGLPGST